MAGAVDVERFTKRFGRTGPAAVDDLTLAVAPGEVYGFLGPNGSGKSTTLRAVLGFLRPTSGAVRVFGRDAFAEAPALHARLGYVPGDLRLPPRRTGQELLGGLARLHGDVDPGRVDQLVARLGVDLHKPVRALSKGNRQKLGLIQAFMGRPRLLVLDEPTSGLDPLVQEELHALVREAAADGAAVLLSSHVLGEVERVADRVGVLRHGRLVREGRLEEIRAAASRHVTARTHRPVDLGLLPEDVVATVDGDELRTTVPAAALGALVTALVPAGLLDLRVVEPDLEELFLSSYEDGD